MGKETYKITKEGKLIGDLPKEEKTERLIGMICLLINFGISPFPLAGYNGGSFLELSKFEEGLLVEISSANFLFNFQSLN